MSVIITLYASDKFDARPFRANRTKLALQEMDL